MAVLVYFTTVNRRGQPQREQRRIEASPLLIGRGSQSHIHLPDARVALERARIHVAEGAATIEAVNGTVDVNGKSVQRARLTIGDRIQIGPYELAIEKPPEDLPLALSVSANSSLAPSAASMLTRVRLSAPRLSKRRLSYILFFGVLFLTLVVPIASDVMSDVAPPVPSHAQPMVEDMTKTVAGRFAELWNPGQLSRSHQVFGRECRACHEMPFIQVRDQACVTCHKKITAHVSPEKLTGPKGVEFSQTRCAECHRDHKGMQMAPRAQELCADCHADVKSVAPGAQSQDARDFRDAHPEFRLSLIDPANPKAVRRVRLGSQATELVERSNLKFTHELHLDPRGVRHPAKGRVTMQCADCHKPDENGRLMAPVRFEPHCQECHSLAFEPKISKREVPHGSEEQVLTTLREFFARLVLGDVPPDTLPPPDLPRMRPGAEVTYQERQQALRIADERAQRVLRELYDNRKVCAACHYISRTDAGYKVAPVAIARTWMPYALFTHAKHSTAPCAACHDVARSKDSKDIAMPALATCRECHVGARAVLGKVTSDCATCHKFHASSTWWHPVLQTKLNKNR